MKRGDPLTRRTPLRKPGFRDLLGLWKGCGATTKAWLREVRGRKPLRRTPLRPVTKDAAKRRRRFARQYGSAAFVVWLKAQPCQFAGVPTHRCGYFFDRPTNEAAHIRPRGAGHGATLKDGTPNLLTLCPRGHDYQGLRTDLVVLQESGVDLWERARAQATAFAREQGR